MKNKKCTQKHHIIYKDGKNKFEVTRNVRKGIHFALTMIRRYKHLTNEEIETIKIEAELKRRYENEGI